MPKCSTCRYYEENNSSVKTKTKKGMMKPHAQYCLNGKMNELTYSSMGIYGYPIWCPLNVCHKTCIECGARIREEEGNYCEKHK